MIYLMPGAPPGPTLALQTVITMSNRLHNFDTRPLHTPILPPRAGSSGKGLVHLARCITLLTR